ncbi:GNAT family N-acetyltransferase [Niallia sp. FSL W8-0951]|uniref:GNAT family N-acetyltransferase n=1 Tax=Niallia TaxID=2837506 RepID=UPI000BA79576|nr:GNAT family N-acetyltransferase [Niallia circulans]PAE10087.1 GNAT family N-acetyltransferase [Niallia circulans]
MEKVSTKTIHPSIRELLSFATTYSKVEYEYEKYLNTFNRQLFFLQQYGEIVGCIGIEIINPNECVIKHIAVSTKQRGKSVGSQMIKFLSKQYTFISAETDNDAVGFYRKNGFKITSLGEKYPSVERFLCVYTN